MDKDTQDIDSAIARNAYRVGDTVRLNSGGPTMTITFIALNNLLTCKWMSPSCLTDSVATFPPACVGRARAGT